MNNIISPEQQTEMIEFLEKLIAVPSLKGEPNEGAPFGVETRKALDLFLAHAETLGFRTKNLDGYCGWAEFGPEDAPLIMGICHLDVVPALGWDDAYEMKIADGKIVGRGSIDDKGPAVSVLYALKQLMDEAYESPCRLRILVGLDEESGSACMKYYNEHAEAPVAAFTSDADFPVIHAEKGHLNFDLVWSSEDSNKGSTVNLVKAVAGSRANVIPGECDIVWEGKDGTRHTEQIVGRMGHASTPWLSENAISKAMEYLYDMAVPEEIDPFVRNYHQVIGMDYSGTGLGISGSDEDSGALTLNAGIINFDKDSGEARITCDVRYPVTWKADELSEKISFSLNGTGFAYEEIGISLPLYRPKDDPLVKVLQSIYNGYVGENTEPIAIGGGTYARSVPNTVAFGPCFPGEESLAHQKNEYILEKTFFDSCVIYREAFRNLAKQYAK